MKIQLTTAAPGVLTAAPPLVTVIGIRVSGRTMAKMVAGTINLAQIAACNGVRDNACASECRIIADCEPCKDKAYNDCVAACR